jgi:predicted O-linked N-acetylglucosamine transferase (SPINDLY family)
MSWIGYPATCGLKAIDYVVLDRFVAPTDESLMVEQAVIMPDAYVCFGKFPEVEIDPTLPMERNGRVTFGTQNNPYKFNRETIAMWARIMSQVPDSRFLIVRPEASSVVLCGNLAAEFGKHGIGADRLYLFDNRTENRDHLSYYNEIDISLDTFPLTGGTTTCEAVWMGVPVVSLVGEANHQRISYSVLMHCGLEELCVFTPEDYVARAVALAGEREKLTAWRTGLRDVMRDSPLCDEPRFLYQFQEMLEQVVRLHGLR